MKLVSIDTLISALNTRDLTDIRETLDTAIEQVTLCLQSVLETQFGQKDVKDYYRLETAHYPESSASLKFRLSQSFVDSGVTVEVRKALSFTDVQTALPITDFSVNNLTGHVEVFPHDMLIGDIVEIKYRAGYANTDGVYDGVAPELASVATAYAFEMYQAMRNWNSDTGKAAYKAVSGVRLSPGVNPIIPQMSPGVLSLAAQLMRNSAIAVHPIRSI